MKDSQEYMSGLDEKLVVNRVPSHIKRKYAKDPGLMDDLCFFGDGSCLFFPPATQKEIDKLDTVETYTGKPGKHYLS